MPSRLLADDNGDSHRRASTESNWDATKNKHHQQAGCTT
jgi:hypothetical protein